MHQPKSMKRILHGPYALQVDHGAVPDKAIGCRVRHTASLFETSLLISKEDLSWMMFDETL